MKDTEYKFETAEEFRANQQLILTKGFNINKLASCLGISSALAGAIASVCAVACAVTAGAGCIACLGLAAGFNIGGSAACIKSAWK
ncbi:hypothetical protein NG54_08000 [Heyndrickxia ginsengihumi]|uniref:Uncharacterized protein n=1 Tax=Heyndrickxia ginsengihumi TaxID=363870 RepID=A0A0A6VBS9_9BACI|nr:hypothetical protein [Heyndrickxia ginsengihumi]KHD85690.1 hypothetical protein NG54_08000 [Heyndrickxia ginsengihumi]